MTLLAQNMNDAPFLSIDHIQLAMPAGEEQRARDFFVRVLGMMEMEKPAALQARGGCWFRSGEVQIHLGVDTAFHPARKAHPALVCRDYDALLASFTARRSGCAPRFSARCSPLLLERSF